MLQHCQEDDALLIYHIDECEQLEAVFYLYEHNREEKEVLEEVLLTLEADIGDAKDHDKTNRKRGRTVVSPQKCNTAIRMGIFFSLKLILSRMV